jgi:hypothetical protein
VDFADENIAHTSSSSPEKVKTPNWSTG